MRIFFILPCFVFSITIFGQKTVLEGKVTDENNNPLEMANVIAISSETGKMESYAITNDKGMYQITLPENAQFNIKVSYLGYNTETLAFITQYGNQKAIKNFVLKEKNSELGEVEIKYTMPITVKGDTIVYNTDSFTTGNEKKLEDVLEKLPGVNINDDGQVEVEGTQVSKVMVNGKDFFDGDTKLATKNISADKVDKVEVLKNYSEVSQLRGLENDQDAIALNIKLKQGKENFWFGEITGGVGLDEKYLAHPKVFYYSPQKSLNILTDFNNIGEVPFTIRDYFKFSGGFKNMMKKGGNTIRINSDQLGISLLNNDKALSVTSKFGALNFNYSPSKGLDLSGFAIYSDAETLTHSENLTQYTASQIQESVSQKAAQRNQLGMLKLSSNYKPSEFFEWNYDVMFKESQQSDKNTSMSSLTGEIYVGQDQNPVSINQNSDLYYTLNEKNIFSFGFQHYYDKNNPLYNAVSTNEFFENAQLLNLQPDVLYDLTQNKELNTNKLDTKIDYFYMLNSKSNLNLTLGNTHSNQSLKSNIFQTLTDENIYHFADNNLNNKAEFVFNDFFLALHYNLKWKKLTLTPGVSLHQFNLVDTQFDDVLKQSKQKLLPEFYAEYQFKNSRSLRLEYGITNEFSDINKLAKRLIIKSYNALSGGNRDLKNALYHTYSLRYFDFNMYNFTHIHSGFSYKKSIDPVKTTTQIVSNESVTLPINMLQPEENISGNINAGKKFKKWEINAGSMLNYGKNFSLINNREVESKSLTQNYTLSIETRFNNFPNFELGYNYSASNFTGSQRNSKYITQRPYIELEANFFKNFTWTADYSYYKYTMQKEGSSNYYNFFSSKLYYQKEGSKWEFILSGENILGTGSQNQNTANDFSVSTSKYYVQPAVYMITLKYDL